MHLTIKRGDEWAQTRIVLGESGRKDYDHAQTDGVEVFVYGYPYHKANKRWLAASELCQSYLQSELGFVDQTDGVYAIVVLDRMKAKCLVIIDRYAIYNLVYTKRGGNFTISDSMGELLTQLPKVSIDRRSLLDFCNFGFVLGNKTHIDGIYQFKPAAVHTIDSNLDISEESYWKFVGEWASSKVLSKEELRALFNHNILTAFALGERVSMPLTGGLDSRVALSACLPKKERLHCYTHGIEGCLDIKIARTISAMVGISHDAYTLTEEWVANIPQTAEKHAEVMDGRVTAILSAHLENSFSHEATRGEVFFTGVGGEMLRCYYAKPDLLNLTSYEDVAANLRKRIQLHAPFDVYADHDPEEVKLLLDASVLEEIKNAKVEDPVLLAEDFYLRNRIGNFASPQVRMIGQRFKIFNPYLNANILESVPFFDIEEKRRGDLQKYILSRNSSELSNIPTNHEEITAIKKAAPKQYRRKALNKVAKALFGRSLFQVSSGVPPSVIARFTDYPSWLRNYHSEYVTEVLDHNSMLLKEFFSKGRLNSVVDSFLSGEERLCYFVTNIMTLEIWFRKMSERTNVEIH